MQPYSEEFRARNVNWCFFVGTFLVNNVAHKFITLVSASGVASSLCILHLPGADTWIKSVLCSKNDMVVKGQAELSNEVSLGKLQPFFCYTPPLSSRLITNFTMASRFSCHLWKFSTKCVFFSFPSTRFSLWSPTRVLWPLLELNEPSLIIKGISGVQQWRCCILQALWWLFLVFEISMCLMRCVLIAFPVSHTLLSRGHNGMFHIFP